MPELSVTCDNIGNQIVTCDIILFRVRSYPSIEEQGLSARMGSIAERFDARTYN
jgi:hypothetical protein